MANSAGKVKKTFVLDTNVLLHDYRCIHNFEEHDIVIPITALEELDKRVDRIIDDELNKIFR